jgi:hypothetical protein
MDVVDLAVLEASRHGLRFHAIVVRKPSCLA